MVMFMSWWCLLRIRLELSGLDISLYSDTFWVNHTLFSFLHIISQNMITLLILVAMDIVNMAFCGAYITEMPVPGKEIEWSCICVSMVPILPLSTIFHMKVEAVLTVWYFVSFILFFSIKLYTTYTCFVVRSELLFVLVFCVALCFVVLLVFVLFRVCPKMPVPLDRPIFISSSVFYNVYCRVKLLLFAIEYFILLQT
jgi:hypothetical protein